MDPVNQYEEGKCHTGSAQQGNKKTKEHQKLFSVHGIPETAKLVRHHGSLTSEGPSGHYDSNGTEDSILRLKGLTCVCTECLWSKSQLLLLT
jgi:hypothetical protein